MRRKDATDRLVAMLERVVSGEWPAGVIAEIVVFGSYARGAQQVGDVDLFVTVEPDERLSSVQLNRMLAGDHGNPYRELDRVVRRGARILHPIYERRFHVEDAITIYQRGDDLEAALQRLRSIREDPNAGRAPREPIIPELAGLEAYVVASDRTLIDRLASAGFLRVERVELPDGRTNHAPTARLIARRWSPKNPRFRAAHAACAYLERHGEGPWHTVPGHSVRAVLADPPDEVTIGLSFGNDGLSAGAQWMARSKTRIWLDVVRATAKGSMIAIILRPGRHAGPFESGQRPGLAAALRA